MIALAVGPVTDDAAHLKRWVDLRADLAHTLGEAGGWSPNWIDSTTGARLLPLD